MKLARITEKHPFYTLQPEWQTKVWQVRDVDHGRAILVDSKGGNLFADVGWWEEVHN